jgi:hypothetical protein
MRHGTTTSIARPISPRKCMMCDRRGDHGAGRQPVFEEEEP